MKQAIKDNWILIYLFLFSCTLIYFINENSKLLKTNEELISIIKQQSALLKRNVEFNESTWKMYKELRKR